MDELMEDVGVVLLCVCKEKNVKFLPLFCHNPAVELGGRFVSRQGLAGKRSSPEVPWLQGTGQPHL